MVGVPRSGTTLLRLLLDAHPDVAIPSETGFGLVLAERPGGYATPADLLDRLEALPTWGNLATSRAELAPLIADLPRWDPADALRAYYRAYANRHGKRRWGDKTPMHVEHMPVIAAAFPEARFVHIIRDGRGVLASLRWLPFAPGDGGVEAIAGYWRDVIACAREAAPRLPHYREVRYEQLVREPEAVLRGVCEFLELDFDPRMLDAHEHARERFEEVAAIRAAGGFDNLPAGDLALYEAHLRPPLAARADAWRDELSAAEVEGFERIAGDTLSGLGYSPGKP